MIEVWIPISSAPEYEASNLGRIRSMDRMVPVIVRGKRAMRRQVGKVLSCVDNGSGYRTLQLGKGNRYYVHRLVAEAFLGQIPEGMWVCHNDGNPANNSAENLRYDTAKNNEADKKKHGTRKPEKSHLAVLTELQVRAIRELRASFPQSDLAKIFGVSQPTISRVLSGSCWSNRVTHGGNNDRPDHH